MISKRKLTLSFAINLGQEFRERGGADPANSLFLLPFMRSQPTVAFDAAGGDNVSMSRDDTSDFRPRPGRIRDHGARKARQPKSFFAQVMKAAAKANGGPLTSAQLSGGSQHSPVRPVSEKAAARGSAGGKPQPIG